MVVEMQAKESRERDAQDERQRGEKPEDKRRESLTKFTIVYDPNRLAGDSPIAWGNRGANGFPTVCTSNVIRNVCNLYFLSLP
jgi:hypothetical protein